MKPDTQENTSIMKWFFTLPVIIFPLLSNAQDDPADFKVVHESSELVITQLSRDVYMHTSFLDSETFGRVPCNGMIVALGKEAIVFDTPATEGSSAALIDWLRKDLRRKIKAVVCTHFHADCVGGLDAFNRNNIPSYAERRTIELAKAHRFNVPAHAFTDSLVLSVGGKSVFATYFGEGHTVDNIVGYYPEDDILFGGCLIKALGAGKGNLEDANVNAWPGTVERVKERFPHVKLVIPGHGKFGDKTLLDYTVKMFGLRQLESQD